ncbi:hypothetical protein L226DRAFT_206529 [Lentinus tigrinus ALCF2SS1-7]|uniref:uncharacterized protein n=1 Tax=Lentinus tigrinus ALCF2SS1-7 TaxID=1328758 RepID=UPI001165FB26|nr:hypothetical protein L226DRAFT_206529 [Lentinus tigrinus ALCF2SS1-7]
MSHDGARHIAPLSPPPTLPVTLKELPSGDEFQNEDHHVDSWGCVLEDGTDASFFKPRTAWSPRSPVSIEDGVEDGDHCVEVWRYGETEHDGGAAAPFFPPVRDDSGFEEFVPHAESRRFDGSHENGTLIESPLCIDDFPLDHLPTFSSALSGGPGDDRSSGPTDTLVSPISLSDVDGGTDRWSSGSDMDWTSSPASPTSTFVDHVSAPSSPKPGCLSLDLPPLDSPLGFQPHAPFSHLQQPSPVSPNETHWFGGEPQQPPSLPVNHGPFMSISYVPYSLQPPPPVDIDAEYPDTIMPPEEDDDEMAPPPSPRRRPLNDLHEGTLPHGDLCVTPVPRSPRSPHFALPDYDSDMEDASLSEPPSSPHSPHLTLPELEDELPLPGLPSFPDLPPIETISPSLLGGAPEEQQPHDPGLGLFLQPLSDPPLARSPSPDEDDFGFLDIQLDPESVNVEIDEFLQLRALRKHALAQERAARMAEAELTERITAAASALLPPSSRPSSSCSSGSDSDSEDGDVQMHTELDPAEKRMRKRELHSMMDMRVEARRARKLQKQRSKEIGALLDFKMHPPSSPVDGLPPLVWGGKPWTRSVYHLLAHMMMRRRDRAARPLESKPVEAHPLVRKASRLRLSLSAEDLLDLGASEDMSAVAGAGDVDADGDDDMEMI